MRIRHVEIENFRLLRNVAVGLEERTTLIVGRNNSGKTSIAELFRRLLSERTLAFKLEDFSLGCHEFFWNAFEAYRAGDSASDVLGHLPSITIRINIAYDVGAPDLGPLSASALSISIQTVPKSGWF
jgi:putative ATP-dependent endonuclease of the OLD family